jgi:hypothetical protein
MKMNARRDILTNLTQFEEEHKKKLKFVESVFVRLQLMAMATGKVNDCSLSKICTETGVSSSYFSGLKPKSNPDISEQYNMFARRVTTWRTKFQDHKNETQDETELGKALKKTELRESERNKAHQQNANLIAESENLRARLVERDGKVSELHAKATNIDLNKSEQRRLIPTFSEAKIVSPDDHLYKNGMYHFDDKTLRDIAWTTARHELITLLQRPIPMRVYILSGLSGSGKTEWSKGSNYFEDRHSVVIDATNLTVQARAHWLNIIIQEKYKLNADIKSCAVVFDVPYSKLIERNKKQRKINELRYLELYQSQEKIDIPAENFDEILVVRHG